MAVDVSRPPQAPVGEAGRGRRVMNFMEGVRVELRKVTWPDLPQVRQATIAIIIFVLMIGLVIFILDAGLNGILVRLIPSLFAGR